MWEWLENNMNESVQRWQWNAGQRLMISIQRVAVRSYAVMLQAQLSVLRIRRPSGKWKRKHTQQHSTHNYIGQRRYIQTYMHSSIQAYKHVASTAHASPQYMLSSIVTHITFTAHIVADHTCSGHTTAKWQPFVFPANRARDGKKAIQTNNRSALFVISRCSCCCWH